MAKTQWDASISRITQEVVEKKVEESLSDSEFSVPLVKKIAEDITQRLTGHPEIEKIIQTEIKRVARKEGLGLSAVGGKSRFARNWILFVAGIGVGTYGLVALIGWLVRPSQKSKT